MIFNKSPLIAPNSDLYRYTIGDDGVAMIELSPTTQTGEVVVRVNSTAADLRKSALGSSRGTGIGSSSAWPKARWDTMQ